MTRRATYISPSVLHVRVAGQTLRNFAGDAAGDVENQPTMKIQIKSIAGAVLFEGDFSCIADAVKAAIKSSANLSSADLSSAKADYFDVLLRAKNEVAGLRDAIKEGRINGSAYEGECACLVGTLANVAHKKYDALPFLMLVCHGAAHNDTICLAERKRTNLQGALL